MSDNRPPADQPEVRDAPEITELVVSGGRACPECHATAGVHLVTCQRFHCKTCGKRGADEDHRGGCPTVRRDEVRWQCQCGASGWMNPTKRTLSALVRQARREHMREVNACRMPDIEKLETRDEYERNSIRSRCHADVF